MTDVGAASEIARAYGISPELAVAIVGTALSVGAHPYDLANEIWFESGRTFSPSIRNPRSGATGLIQFASSTARELGTTTEALAGLTALEQMRWVRRYLDLVRRGRKLDTSLKVAMAVFYRDAIGWSPEQRFPPDVVADNTLRVFGERYPIRTPADYLRLVGLNARLPSSAEGAPPVSSPGGSPLPLHQDDGLFDQFLSWIGGFFSSGDDGTGGAPGDARWDLAAGASGVLVDDAGRSWPPGSVPPGIYRLQGSSGTSDPTRLVAGGRYRASAIGRLFPQ